LTTTTNDADIFGFCFVLGSTPGKMAGPGETAELYGRVKAATDKFFVTLREARNLESQGKTNLVSP